MANTYTQIYLHIIVSVSGRACVVASSRREELQKYITGDRGFSWQEGYGAFSVSHSHLNRVANYIRNQETHHRRKSFQQEYIEFLARHHVPYDQRYIFKPVE
jgi:putative transposase